MKKWIQDTILARVRALCLLVLTLFVVSSGAFYVIDRQIVGNQVERDRLEEADKLQMWAMAHHERVRALIYGALAGVEPLSSTSSARSEIDAAALEFAANRREFERSELPPDMRQALEGVDFAPYLSAAKAALDAIDRDRTTASGSVQAFDAEFQKLEPILDRSGKSLEALAEAKRVEERQLVRTAELVVGILSVLGALCIAALGAIVVKSMLNPFHKLVSAIKRLAAGETDIDFEGEERTDEIGDLARSIVSFRNAVLEKQRHQAESEAARVVVEEERRKKDELDKYYVDAHAVFMSTFTAALEHLSAGDLNYRLDTPYINEYESIRSSFNQAADRIQKAMVSIVSSSSEIRMGTERILSAADELARHTEEQASSLEETSASMEEMAATVRQNANNAQEASATAFSTRELAAAGGAIAEQAVSAMEKIEQSSRQVTEIVDLIEEIAFQTNILALNAAVEAARAGDAGKGFAVVANEVRTLSQRSSQALKDIKALITSSNANVNDGAALVKAVGNSLTDIVTSVSKVSELISEIAAASQEQASGVDQVTRAVANMDEMTQQNAALVQETNAALHTAQQQIHELNQAVSMFDTGREHAMQFTHAATRGAGRENPVREQQRILEKKLRPAQKARKAGAARGKAESAAAAVAFDDDWQEF